MPANDPDGTTYPIVEAVGERIGVPVADAELVHFHSNAIFVLPSAGLLVRIATNPDALARITASVRVTRWLAQRGFPCVVPADIDDQPFVHDRRVVSIWNYVPTLAEARPTGADLGQLLRRLHDQPIPPHPPEQLTDPLRSVANAVEATPAALPEPSRTWLTTRISQLRDAWRNLEFPQPPALIHGDAHPGNILTTPTRQTVLGDWDHVAIGPREWDLTQIHYTHQRFGHPAEHDLDSFAKAYGWDLRGWSDHVILLRIREISGLSAYIRTAATKSFSHNELMHRLDTLQSGQTTARWRSPTDHPR